MELELSLSPPYQKRQPTKKNSNQHNHRRSITTKPHLVSWNQDDNNDEHNNTFFNGDYHEYLEDKSEGLDGWPPLHSWRKRFMEENHEIEGVGFDGRMDEESGSNNNVMDNDYHNNHQSLFVKVKMDGVGIARKIDLNAFDSYHMLTTTLIHMFDKCVEVDEDGSSYSLMYQHKDGHWLLAGDNVPWEYNVHSYSKTYPNGQELTVVVHGSKGGSFPSIFCTRPC